MIPLAFAALVTFIAVVATFIIQALLVRRRDRDIHLKRRVVEFARERGGVVTPRAVAAALGIPVHQADRMLRHMVNEEHLAMDIDTTEGELRFAFQELLPSGPERRRGSSRGPR